VVDKGDWIRLIFDREVRIDIGSRPPSSGTDAGRPGCPVRVPEDILLSSTDDWLDDGNVPAVFEEGSSPKEVRIVLGSSPHLTIAGRHRPARDRLSSVPLVSSGLSVNGTSVQPMSASSTAADLPGRCPAGP